MNKAIRDVPLSAAEMQPVAVAHLGLHSHTCTECGAERACYQSPCAFRGRRTHLGDRRTWRCGACVEQNANQKAEVAA